MSPALVALSLAVAVAAPTAPSSPDSPWLYLIGGGGLLGILTWASKLYLDIRSGRAQQKEARAADIVKQRDTAWNERDNERARAQEEQHRADVADRRADCEARNARRLWDYAARLRRVLIEQGYPTGELPVEPMLEDCSLIGEDNSGHEPGSYDARPRGRR